MKKIYILTAVFALLTLSLNAQLTTSKNKVVKPETSTENSSMKAPNRATNSVTVGDQTSDTQFLPVYGWWYDGYQVNQMIYSADQLGIPSGSKIKSITFYPYNGLQLDGGTITFSLGTTTATSLSALISASEISNLTQVKTITPNANSSLTEWTITFDNDFTYNGNNLLVQINTANGSDDRSYFYGQVQQNNVCYYTYGYSNPPTNTGSSNILPKATFTYEDLGPTIEVSPETLTINDSGTNNTFTVQGSNLGNDNVGLTQTNNEFTPTLSTTTGTYYDGGTYWGFTPVDGSVNGTVAMTYNGRALSASTTEALGNNTGASATFTVNYVPDLYIYCDNGASPWDFSANPAVAMTNNGDGTYTATLQNIPNNSHILFGRASGLTYYWEGDGNRLFFGASTDGGDWGYGDNTSGYLDTNPNDDYPVKYHPIYFSEGGTYTVTIDATNYTFTITKLVYPAPENVVATPNSENKTATVTWDVPSNLPTVPGTVNQSVTEGFENGTTGWTFIDADGDGHNWTWYDSSSASSNMITHSGNCIVYSESYINNASGNGGTVLYPDNWLISPEVVLDGTLSLYACGQDENGYHNEVFGVYVCVGSYNGTSSFVQVGADVTTTHEMKEYTYDLSQYQGKLGHIAIVHHNVYDQFILNIDDVTYQIAVPSQVTMEPVSYNVYLDGQLVGSVNANDPLTYDFSNVAVGDHECAVSAVYPNGIESEATPAEFTIMGKTDMPTINVVANADGSKTVTATGNGTIHLYVDGVEVSNPYTIMPSPDGDISVTVTATAQEEGKLISETAEQIVTVAEAGRTPMPVITYVEHNGYVEIIATGDGTITLEAGGQTAGGVGSASIIIVRSLEDQDITATATAKAEGLEESHPATEDILVEALSTTPTAQTKEGLLRLHLLIVDQMKQEIPADNSHPDVYGYVLKYEPNGPGGEGTRESGTVDVRIQKADCEVMGAYTLTEVDNDKNIGRRDEQGNIVHDQGIKMQVITADVAYDLSSTNDMLWEYILQGAENRLPNYNQDYLTRLQKTQNFTYVEMLDGAPDEGHEYPNGEHHYFSAYNPVTGVFNADNLETGAYATDYMTYAPSVSTWGVQRRYFEDDGLDNTYGAPYWKTAAGKVTMDDSELMAERQKNQWNSVNWTTDAGTASLYILDKVKAVGLLPHTGIATVQYEPYMFRIFVESPSGKLRPYKVVEAVEGSTTEGEHLEALVPDNQLTDAQKYGPISVWESYIKYDEDGNIIGADPENGVMITTGADNEYQNQTAYTFQKNKVQRDATPAPTEENPNPTKPIWDKDSNNAMFGALNAISPETGKISTDDLKVFVRFYYAVKGELADHTVVRYNAGNRGEGSRSGNGAESGGGSAGAATSVFEIDYHGEVVGQTYYNIQGMESEKPFDGVNIVVTRYSDGSTSVAKIVR